MNFIGPQHHKDRDCHFYIERKWSYGNPPVWIVNHYGYWINDEFNKQVPTYREAVQTLINFLQENYDELSKDD